MTQRTVSLNTYRALAADARAALRMIREVVEQNAITGLPLGGLLGRDGQADHGSHPRDGPRSEGRPGGGFAALDADACRQRRTARGPPRLLGAVRGGGGGRGGKVGTGLTVRSAQPDAMEVMAEVAPLKTAVARGGPMPTRRTRSQHARLSPTKSSGGTHRKIVSSSRYPSKNSSK